MAAQGPAPHSAGSSGGGPPSEQRMASSHPLGVGEVEGLPLGVDAVLGVDPHVALHQRAAVGELPGHGQPVGPRACRRQAAGGAGGTEGRRVSTAQPMELLRQRAPWDVPSRLAAGAHAGSAPRRPARPPARAALTGDLAVGGDGEVNVALLALGALVCAAGRAQVGQRARIWLRMEQLACPMGCGHVLTLELERLQRAQSGCLAAGKQPGSRPLGRRSARHV